MERTIKEDFARYADNEAMNEHLKDQLYMEDDPMAHIISKKRQKVRERTTLGKTACPTAFVFSLSYISRKLCSESLHHCAWLPLGWG